MRTSGVIEHAAYTHGGRRSNNEDAILSDPEHGLFAVADGMGGYEGGEVASQLTVETVREFFAQNAYDGELTWPWGAQDDRSIVENVLAVAVRLANREVHERRRGKLAQMGSTIVALAIDGPCVAIAHVGDSRIYRLRGDKLEQLTRDHSLVEEMRARGMKEVPEGMGHVVTRAIGAAKDTEPDVRREPVRMGDTFLLCSDGVTDALEDIEIEAYLRAPNALEACRLLVRAAYDAGGTDNITAIVLRWSKG